jgi:hypothetical protein
VLASSITDTFSIARRAVDLPIGRQTLEQAATLPGSDFEDNMPLAGASIAGLDALVTRNPSDFVAAALPILTPAALLSPL